MHRFFVDKEQIQGDTIEIVGKDTNHIKDVLRLKKDDIIEISSGGRVYICKIIKFDNKKVITKIIKSFQGKHESPIHIALYQGIAKGDKMDYLIQKVTEIGVKEIYPIITNRTIVKIKNKKKEQSKLDRWRAIAEEAAKQSKRDFIPKVQNIMSFKEMLDKLEGEKNIIVPYEMEKSISFKDILNNIEGEKINLIIGPEGGFEREEIQLLKSVGGQSITLGSRILRTETAGLVASTIILYELGDLGVMK
ncbi:16S rRNA (uracil1498-N3)-methyltransferase [Keratinibaculum paraultunense]|uniref:Ribosomal RNA small subunit methyltransferase E n=1 Tax=Keratinibaculum paraultunense TaxID=1278232 RepID=A0A4R3KZS2_9FIRM|nr:16S rRNA (uracil(1498)-N(3))-methyltransferase [Keratinibaculum paraultunense]MBU5455494.1 16S rRNA (uracil(1498)-N(3))-methyltransferase [Caproiciproducens sp. MSJ-32]QQY80464.1 16S rRNA (uracil(1498)-N(3))-methyltransferase [Keratinibaculum paraultunense]TCS91182.1 16S rRNA (uracil1498-N3)-methyltransferase [Keratinibaculum paraultunense]